MAVPKALVSSKKWVCGLSVVDPKLQDSVVDWVSKAAGASRGSNADQRAFRPLTNLHLILFDSHAKALPLKFLARKPTSMVLVESIQNSASAQREFVAKYSLSQQYPPSDSSQHDEAEEEVSVSSTSADSDSALSTLLFAYHSSFKDLIVPSKSKPYNERFLKVIFTPDVEYFDQAGVKSDEIEKVAFGCLPSPALQRTLLHSLYVQWLVYVHNQVEKELCGHFVDGTKTANEITKTVYEISNFTLITFLHPTTFAQIVCGKYEPKYLTADQRNSKVEWLDETMELAKSGVERLPLTPTKRGRKEIMGGPLAFYAKSHRHYSFLFNILFDVRLLNGWQGFPVHQAFAPVRSDPKETGHLEKLEELGLSRDDFYALSVRPRRLEELHTLMEAHDIDLRADIEEIVRVAFWLTDFTPKLRGTKPFNDELRRLLNTEDLKNIFQSDRLVNEVLPPEYLAIYPSVRSHFADDITPEMHQRYTSFRDQFLKASARNYVD